MGAAVSSGVVQSGGVVWSVGGVQRRVLGGVQWRPPRYLVAVSGGVWQRRCPLSGRSVQRQCPAVLLRQSLAAAMSSDVGVLLCGHY